MNNEVIGMEELPEKKRFEVTLCSDRMPRFGGKTGIVTAYQETTEFSRNTYITILLSDGITIKPRVAACCNPVEVVRKLQFATDYFEKPENKRAIDGRKLIESQFGNDTIKLTGIGCRT